MKATLRRALVEARGLGVAHIHWVHIGQSLLSDGDNDASDLLRSLDVRPERLLTALSSDMTAAKADSPLGTAVNVLFVSGILTAPERGILRAPLRIFQQLFAGPAKRQPVSFAIESEAIRQAVRLDHPQVNDVHLLVAIAALDQQLHETGYEVRKPLAMTNRAGTFLRATGITYPAIARRAAEHQVATTASDTSTFWRRFSYNPPVGNKVAEILDAARTIATAAGTRQVGTDHILLALLANPDSPAAKLLTDLEVDPTTLRAKLS